MNRRNQYPEQGCDHVALLLLDFARVQSVEVDSWRLNTQPENLLVAHPTSAGHGLNLQNAGNVFVHFGHRWNLEECMQIPERIARTRQKQAGHDRPVSVHCIIARDTIDAEVIERVATKREVPHISMNAMKRRFQT